MNWRWRERAGGQEHWQPLRWARDGPLLRVVRSQPLGVGTDDACFREVVEERHRFLAVDHGRCPIGLRRAVQHVEPDDHLEVKAHLEVPRLDQLDPLVGLLGCAAQRSARGGELRALSKVQHYGRRVADHAPVEGAEVDHLLGTQRALFERQFLGVLGQIVPLPLEPVAAACLIGIARLGVGGHGARHARARVETVGECAADGGQRQVVVGAARTRHVQVALGQEVVEHRDVGEQVAAHLARVDEEEAARRPLAVHEDCPVGEGVVVADDVRQ
eukprot:scaffold133318_cov72-Phaeocystis_antarctica.AAC.5